VVDDDFELFACALLPPEEALLLFWWSTAMICRNVLAISVRFCDRVAEGSALVLTEEEDVDVPTIELAGVDVTPDAWA